MKKLFHAAVSVLFFYIAWLQFNDPDPLFWILLYFLVALVPLRCLLPESQTQLHTLSRFLPAIASGYCLAALAMVASGALDYIPHLHDESLIQDMSAERPYIEEAREWLGTLIGLITVTIYWFMELKNKR